MKTLLLAGASLALAGTAAAQDYSYSGETGPANWGGVCATGIQQSPIDLNGAVEAEGIMPALAWHTADSVELTRNSLNFTANTDAGTLILNGVRYDLIQFHFHSLSEHTVDGEAYPLEVHFVHASEDGNLAVVGVFYEEGDENPELTALWNAIPAAGETGMVENLDLTNFLPGDMDGFRYSGSLTTPPCSEVVAWTVLSEPLEASAEQIEAYQGLFGDTARPTLPHNRRFVLEND
ncbi:carbonic anhydrase [Hyphobacterium sp.]|uniref:carbonic anhydrase n=1 Tax=Hyphobacterium sp. TaxID=2004662 RepID=UPI003BACF647